MDVEKKDKQNLREACIREAMTIVDKLGVEELSMREVTRRLGVSHQAPYKHFSSRDHILAEMVSRAYKSFSDYLENRPMTGDPDNDLGSMGQAYIEYANQHPLQYRLMFGTPLPDPEQHPDMMRHAQGAFSLLRESIENLHASRDGQGPHRRTEFDALFIWFTLHGLCSVMHSRVVESLDLPKAVMASMSSEIFERFRWVLDSETEISS